MDRSIRSKITCGTKEWADYNFNCCYGCFNDCRYSYAKKMALRFGRATEQTWREMKVRYDELAKPYKKMKGRVMFPTAHDIIDIPHVEEACFITLNKLLENQNDVLVTTKPRFNIIRKIDECFSNYKGQLQFRFTITSMNDELLKFWEPNAPRFEERMESLKFAFEMGYKTSVSIEPFLDHDPDSLVKVIEPFCTESIWIGKMNYIARNGIPKEDAPFYESVRRNYELGHLVDIYNRLVDQSKIRFKDSIINKLKACS